MKKRGRFDTRFSKRESEVMDVLFRKGSATAREVWNEMGRHPTYSTIRKILSILEGKGHLTHTAEGQVFVYSPKQKRETAASSALSRLVETFFQGSVAGAVSSLLGEKGDRLSAEDLDRIARMIEEAKEKTRERNDES